MMSFIDLICLLNKQESKMTIVLGAFSHHQGVVDILWFALQFMTYTQQNTIDHLLNIPAI